MFGNRSQISPFQYLYGYIPHEISQINPFFCRVEEYIKELWNSYKSKDFILSDIYSKRIYRKNLTDMNANKLFNYILQASETEFGMQSLVRVNEYLDSNKKQTKAILYTYDSVLFDCHKDDKRDTLIELKRLMSNNQFPIKCYIGRNYNEMIIADI